MASKLVKKVTDFLTCPVCHETFDNPKYLPCHHTYCMVCIKRLIKDFRVKCPECCKEYRIATGGAEDLPSNFFIYRLVDEITILQKVKGDEEISCDKCKKKKQAVSYCMNCGIFMCQLCHNYHSESMDYDGHHIAPIAELKGKESVSLKVQDSLMKCKKHKLELLFYCADCEQLICMYCTVKDHKDHNHDTVEVMAAKLRDDPRDKKVIEELKKVEKKLSNKENNIGKMLNDTDVQVKKEDKKMEEFYNDLIKKIELEKKEKKERLYKVASQMKTSLERQLEEVGSAQTKVKDVTRLYNSLEESSDQELLSSMKEVVSQVSKVVDSCRKVSAQPVKLPSFAFVPTGTQPTQFGTLHTGATSCCSTVEGIPQHAVKGQAVNAKVTAVDRCGVVGGNSKVVVDIVERKWCSVVARDHGNGSYSASFVPESDGEVKVSVSADGQLIKSSPYNVPVCRDYRAVDKPSKVVTANGEMRLPWGVAFGNDGIWAAASQSKHCVHVFDSQDQLVRAIGRYGSNNGELDYPKGIAFDKKNYLYVADYTNHRVQKFTIDGKYVLQFGNKGKQNEQLNGPCGIGVHQGRVYVAEWLNSRVSVFQLDGQFCRTIGSGHCGAPSDVAIGPSGQLLVTDWSHHCVYSFTADGEYTQKFGQRGSSDGQLSYPYSLTTDLYGFVLVCDTSNHRISVFDENAGFVCFFGSHGSADGQFDHPRGIALSPSGSIYVSDHNNHRIQIFSNY